jgi:hypothetical protein
MNDISRHGAHGSHAICRDEAQRPSGRRRRLVAGQWASEADKGAPLSVLEKGMGRPPAKLMSNLDAMLYRSSCVARAATQGARQQAFAAWAIGYLP